MRALRWLAWLPALLAGAACAQDYPGTRPVRLVVPFAAGAATDALARVVADQLQKAMGGSFVVDNKPGANGLIAAESFVKAAPDGYTLFITTHTTQAANPALYKKLPYDPLKDMAPVARLTSAQFVLCVHPALAARNVGELIAYARANPGELAYATTNSTSLVAAEWLKTIAGLEITGVPYKSNPAAMTDLIAGRIPLMFADLASAVPQVKAGRLRALAVTGTRRSALLPDLPTMREAGVAALTLNTWAAIYAPAATPVALIERVNGAVNAALRKPEVIERIGALGYDVVTSTPQELARFHRDEIDIWARAVRAARIPPEQ
jgi:tripartite-type tricarboxylate transporter receptor subunit TctC